jgi:hypothetical protein
MAIGVRQPRASVQRADKVCIDFNFKSSPYIYRRSQNTQPAPRVHHSAVKPTRAMGFFCFKPPHAHQNQEVARLPFCFIDFRYSLRAFFEDALFAVGELRFVAFVPALRTPLRRNISAGTKPAALCCPCHAGVPPVAAAPCDFSALSTPAVACSCLRFSCLGLARPTSLQAQWVRFVLAYKRTAYPPFPLGSSVASVLWSPIVPLRCVELPF